MASKFIASELAKIERLNGSNYAEALDLDWYALLQLPHPHVSSMTLPVSSVVFPNIRGQGYDGASNMRGAWSGLKSLFLQECPYAYYVHCFAHRLQLALVAASGELSGIELFFQMLNCIVNLVRVSPKRNQQLRAAQREEVENLMERGELQTSTGGNQQTTLRRPASTRWGSHYSSACSLLGLYKPVWKVLGIIKADGLNRKIRAEASGGFTTMGSFDFVFTLHLMVEIMGVTEVLCQSLQRKDQDILTGMDSISITKTLLCDLKGDDKWQNFLQSVVSFCMKHEIDIPDMSSRYVKGTGRSCQQSDEIIIE
ncbi:zinc finger MYM-type protein 1-like [Asparagus officinalis]|uniref:zinc finger MYM-type protein 1-like n=1 Tax=Asparagus officinalis TaxID=4686 RepID=UPI00098E6423|nr:zinc finger MYM-type protein 1-like [Asparagus officinalis]